MNEDKPHSQPIRLSRFDRFTNIVILAICLLFALPGAALLIFIVYWFIKLTPSAPP